MARIDNLNNFLTDVAGAIKDKKGSETAISAANFDTEILALPSQGVYQTKVITISENGQTIITPDTGYDAMDGVQVTTNIPEKQLQSKSYEFTTNQTMTLLPDTGYDGFSNIDLTINVPGSTINNQDKTITQNGTYIADSGYTGLGEVTVNVPSTSSDVKLFETVEEMQADPNPSEGDLAVVYRNEIQPVTEESEFSSCIFPNTVVLDEAFTGGIYGSFRAVDSSSGYFDGMVDVSSSNFRFDGYRESGQISVQYTSQDGVTYARTDGGEELQEFGIAIKWESGYGEFNSVIGNFIKIGENYFDGLYEYSTKADKTKMAFIKNIKLVEGTLQYDSDIYNGLDIGFITEVYNNIQAHFQTVNSWDQLTFCRLNDEIYCYVTIVPSGPSLKGVELIESETGSLYIGPYVSYKNYDVYKVTLGETYTYTLLNKTTISGKTTLNGVQQIDDTYELLNVSFYPEITPDRFVCYKYTGGEFDTAMKYGSKCDYAHASSQLNATKDYVYEKTFYGKNGVEEGTLGNPDNTFVDSNAKLLVQIQQKYEEMQPRVLTDQDKEIDINILFIPAKKDGTPLLDTSNVTNMRDMFFDCTNLTTIPQLNTSNVTTMHHMFYNCTNLTTIPQLNTSKVTKMYGMFHNCINLTEVPQLDTSNVTDIRYMFNGCINLTEVPQLDTSNVTDMSNMFYNCTNLTEIPLLDTSNVTTMSNMFDNCTNLTSVPQLDTSNVTTMYDTFHRCTNLTTIPQLNTSKVTNMYYMFHSCTNLTTIPQLNTSKVTKMSNMFYNCTNLTNESLDNILAMCKNATKITSNKTLKYIGLTQEQAQICTTLSNWSAFRATGWTTGY